jgi:hypothetical protein
VLSASPDEGEFGDADEARLGLDLLVWHGQAQFGQPPQQRGQGDLQLDAR